MLELTDAISGCWGQNSMCWPMRKIVYETALLEGAVEILQKKSEVSLMKLKPGDMARLSKNQLTKEKIHTTDYFRWKEGLICFNDISYAI